MSTTIPASTASATTLAPETANIEPNATFASWAMLELLGHRQLAGWVTEQQIAGAGFLRIDIPKRPDGVSADATEEEEAEKKKLVWSTQFYAPNAVYGITPVVEEMARSIAYRSQPQPITALELPPAAVDSYDDDDDDEVEDDEY